MFIKALNIHDGRLTVTSESGQTYQVDLNTKAITQTNSASSPPSGAIRDVPDAAKKALTNGIIGKNYELLFRMNPSYLEGDFNGDGKIDTAALVKERSTGKPGIAIVHGTSGKSEPALASATPAMTSTGWIPGRFTPERVPPTAQGKRVSRISAATRFWLRRANPQAR